ncbi:ribose-phosphate diphosphokinase [Patescibacteria group bacterium]|nr:ribose-phosphate diphosphokinase [Patescibacteria group bacterium]
MSRGKLKLIATEAGTQLGSEISKQLKTPLTPIRVDHFADGESETILLESVREQDVFIVTQRDLTLGNSVMEQYEDIKSALYTTLTAKAKHISLIIPLMPMARAHKAKQRQGIQLVRVANELMNAGAQQIITVDIHNSTSIGFFNGKGDNLSSFSPLMEACKKIMGKIDPDQWIVSSVDVNAGRAKYWANSLGLDLNVCWKERNYSKINTVAKTQVLVDVKDKNIIVIDDMIDTGGSFESVVKALHQKGANRIIGCVTHPIFSNKATEKFTMLHKKYGLEKIIATNSVNLGNKFLKKNKWFIQVSLAPILSKTIKNIHEGKSVAEIYAS